MENMEFNLKSVEDVEKFQEMLEIFSNKEFDSNFKIEYSLVECFEKYSKVSNGTKIFIAIIDISINFILIHSDVLKIGIIWNTYFSKGKLEGGSIFDSQIKFNGKMQIHEHYTNFIFRYRAIWDKLMGLIILKSSENDYEKFIKAKSKKKFFKDWSIRNKFEDSFTEFLLLLLTNFDEKFRTAEAHGMGKIRKHTLSMQTMNENSQIEIIENWNTLLKYLSKIILL